ncbi:MAG TPA: HAMP domain-containing protein [Proteobacteria bacterium]|nr:HAMP domain-containing protein [Pseudomonadota bacterium]
MVVEKVRSILDRVRGRSEGDRYPPRRRPTASVPKFKIKLKSIKVKCLLVTVAVVLFCAVAMYVSFGSVASSTMEDYSRSAMLAAISPVAENLVTPILQEDQQKIKTTFLSLVNATKAKYAFILDEDADPFYIAEQDSIPASLLAANKPDKKSAGISQKSLLVDGELVWDYAVPIAKGKLGWIRIGIPASAITETVKSLALLAVVVGGLCLAFGIVITSVVAGRFSRKVLMLAGAVENLSAGESKEPIPISGDDEIGLLAEALERLRLSIQVLKRHPGGL